jgi:hypothetical protein
MRIPLNIPHYRSQQATLLCGALLALFCAYPAKTAHASIPTMAIMHSFGDGSVANDGVWPADSLIQIVGGNF